MSDFQSEGKGSIPFTYSTPLKRVMEPLTAPLRHCCVCQGCDHRTQDIYLQTSGSTQAFNVIHFRRACNGVHMLILCADEEEEKRIGQG